MQSDSANKQEKALKLQTGIFSRNRSGITHLIGGQTDDNVEAMDSSI